MSMRRIALLSVVVALAAAGCQAWTGVSGPARLDEDGGRGTEGTSAIYAAVIRQLLTKDAYLLEGRPFERVFVVRTEGDPSVGTESPLRPFSSAVERAILEALRDLPPVRCWSASAPSQTREAKRSRSPASSYPGASA